MNVNDGLAACARLCDRERRLLNRLFHDSPLMLLIVDSDERPLAVNDTFRRRLGWCLDELDRVGWRFVLEDAPGLPSLDALVQMPGWMDSTFRLKDAQGAVVWAQLTVSSLAGAEEPEWLITLEETSAEAPLPCSGRGLNGLIDALPLGLLTLDASGAVVAANRWAAEALSLPGGVVPGLPLTSYLNLLEGEPGSGQWTPVAPMGVPGGRLLARLVDTPGGGYPSGPRHLVLREEPAQPVSAPDVWETIADVLDLEVAGLYLHNLRQPLHGAILILEAMLGDTGIPSLHRRRLGTALEQCDAVAEGMNAWGRLVAHRTGVAAVGRCVDAALDQLALAAVEAGSVPQVTWHCDPHSLIAVDLLRFTHALRHVIANALEAVRLAAAPGGRVNVSIATTGPKIRITVRDNGIGFPDAWLAPKAPLLTSGWPGGAHRGVGLAYCRQILRAAGGAISWATSGEWTEVVIDVPLLSTADAPEDAPPGPVAARWRSETANRRVLLVDDEAVVLLMADEFLSDHGYNVVTAQDGMEALEAVRRDDFDVVVTDLCMPLLDGYSLIGIMRAEGIAVPVIVLTAFDAAEHLLGADVVSVLSKPFRLQDLLRAVENVVGAGKEGG